MELDRRHLQALVAVAEELNFTRAANRLGLPQPAVSRTIASVERMVGQRLFERSSRQVTLTDPGRELLRKARVALESLRDVRLDPPPPERPPLRLGCDPLPLASLLRLVRGRLGDVDIESSVLGPQEAVAGMASGDLDVVKTYETPLHPLGLPSTARVATILVEPAWLACAGHHRLAGRRGVSMNELRDEPWIVQPPGSTLHTFVVWACQRAGFTPQVRHVCDSATTMQQLIAAGEGVTLATPVAALQHDVVLRPVFDPPQRRLVLAWNPAVVGDDVVDAMLWALRSLYLDHTAGNPEYRDAMVGQPWLTDHGDPASVPAVRDTPTRQSAG